MRELSSVILENLNLDKNSNFCPKVNPRLSKNLEKFKKKSSSPRYVRMTFFVFENFFFKKYKILRDGVNFWPLRCIFWKSSCLIRNLYFFCSFHCNIFIFFRHWINKMSVVLLMQLKPWKVAILFMMVSCVFH